MLHGAVLLFLNGQRLGYSVAINQPIGKIIYHFGIFKKFIVHLHHANNCI